MDKTVNYVLTNKMLERKVLGFSIVFRLKVKSSWAQLSIFYYLAMSCHVNILKMICLAPIGFVYTHESLVVLWQGSWYRKYFRNRLGFVVIIFISSLQYLCLLKLFFIFSGIFLDWEFCLVLYSIFSLTHSI